MNVFTSDWENTTWNKGSAFDKRNWSVCLGIKWNEEPAQTLFDSHYVQWPLDDCLWVFFNAKYDLHWYRRNGMRNLPSSIWCCQLAEFLLSGQKNRYPSLDDTAKKYNLGQKQDQVKAYWESGYNTNDIPRAILEEYSIQDVELTYQIFLKQKEQFDKNPKLYKLFQLQCLDLLVLEEMEWNGLVYDERLCELRAVELEEQLENINKRLCSVYPDIPINFSSGDQLSAFIYGGNIPYEVTEQVGFYKNGKPKFKKVEKVHSLPRLLTPLKGTELKKDGTYKTDEATLRKLSGNKVYMGYIRDLLDYGRLDKLLSTYYKGIPKKNLEFGWKRGEIHGQFNQVVAQTGRLSSSEPNLQNFAEDCLDIFVSRYE